MDLTRQQVAERIKFFLESKGIKVTEVTDWIVRTESLSFRLTTVSSYNPSTPISIQVQGVKMRQIVEREIAEAAVTSLLAAGYLISVDNGDNNGREYELRKSGSKRAILKAMFKTDHDHLYMSRQVTMSWNQGWNQGWVRFVYGNDGWDVISDYTANLESLVGDKSPAGKVSAEYSD